MPGRRSGRPPPHLLALTLLTTLHLHSPSYLSLPPFLPLAVAADLQPTSTPSCSQTCVSGLAETASASCKAHIYNPGLFDMFTDPATRQAGQSYPGDRTRLLAALQRYRDGGNLTITLIGGSITAGQGGVDAPAYPRWLANILNAHLAVNDPSNQNAEGAASSGRLRVHNGAVPGTSSQYMSSCHNVHVPQDSDIVFVEYALNDDEMPMPHMNNQVRRPFERLLRKLLRYPRQPAVVLLHTFRWFHLPVEQTGQFWKSSERQHGEFGLYYGLPQLSVKACCYHHMRAGKEGYEVKRPRADQHGQIQHEGFVDSTLRGRAFFFDVVHPDGNTGHRVIGELAAQLVLDVWAQVSTGYNVSATDLAALKQPLPPPMLDDNRESSVDKCFIGPAFVHTVIQRDGFEWVNEGKNPILPKWGFVSREPGKEIKFSINTNASAMGTQGEVTVELGYLRSYENMGRAAVTCEGGCKCEPWTLDGHHDQHTSQTFLYAFKVSQADNCMIRVKVLQESSTGKHKVKLTGIMVSEEANSGGFQNWAAWDWVALASSKDPNGVFEIGNAARRSLAAVQQASSERLQRAYHEALKAAEGKERRR